MTKTRSHPSLFALPFRGYDGRETLRSLADALDKLRELGGLSERDSVEVKTQGLQLVGGRTSGFVVVLGPAREQGPQWIIQMPSAATFTARTTHGVQHTYDIALLDGAISDSDGNVELTDGRFLHQIDLIPAPFLYEPTWRDELIVRLAAKFLRVHGECYRPLHEELLPCVGRLRYDAVAKVQIKQLKPVIRYVAEHPIQRCLAKHGQSIVSASVIAKALARAGMQLPRSERRNPQ
jgi:hypothetical protein